VSLEKAIEEAVKSLPITDKTILITIDLKKYFPLKRGLTEIFSGVRRYVRAVDGVTLLVNEGEVFCVAGESGCGKTTLGRTILGLEEPTSGYILFKVRKKDVIEVLEEEGIKPVFKDYYVLNEVFKNKRAFKALRKSMQLVFQDPYGSLNPRMTIRNILAEPLVVHGLGTPQERDERVRKILEDVKLIPPEDFIDRYPHQLSGGQRQRIVIARALMLNPEFIVADEPVSMLDVSIRAEILSLLMELKQRYNLTYVFITHDLAVARYICDKIAVMYLGKVVEVGPTDEIIENPVHPYTKALRAAILEPDPKNRFRMREVPIKGEVPSAINIPSGCRFHPRCVEFIGDICQREEPSLIEVKPGHYVACWRYAKK